MSRNVFSIDDDHFLEQIKEKTDKRTNVECIRDALAFYSYVIELVDKGYFLYAGLNPNNVGPIYTPAFEAVQNRFR